LATSFVQGANVYGFSAFGSASPPPRTQQAELSKPENTADRETIMTKLPASDAE